MSQRGWRIAKRISKRTEIDLELSTMLSEGARHVPEMCPPQPSSVANMVA